MLGEEQHGWQLRRRVARCWLLVCMQVLSKLKDDPNEDELERLSEADVLLGRMSGPYRPEDFDLAKVAVASRFSVEQGSACAMT